MTAPMVFVVLLALLGLVLFGLAALGVGAGGRLVPAGLFVWLLAWALLDVFPHIAAG